MERGSHTYQVFAAMSRDINEGWVWVSDPQVAQRPIIRIENKNNGKHVFCECLRIDENFRAEYSPPNDISTRRLQLPKTGNVVAMNEWYRKKLGVGTQAEYELEIKGARHCWDRLRANFDHPQVVVRLATQLALLSVGLGIIGAICGCCSFILALSPYVIAN
jgi:hypothetical protein